MLHCGAEKSQQQMIYRQPSLPTYHCNWNRPVKRKKKKRVLLRRFGGRLVKLIIRELYRPVEERIT